jgi:DNA-binding transcriptional MerR regulator
MIRKVEKNKVVQGTLFQDKTSSKYDNLGYRAPLVCEIVGISYRQLDYWTRTDLVFPSVKETLGSGTKRLYGFKDILILKIIKNLLNAGISLQQVRLAIYNLEKLGVDDMSKITIISDGSSIYQCKTNDEVTDLLSNGQGVFGISVGKVFNDVDATLYKLPESQKDKKHIIDMRKAI